MSQDRSQRRLRPRVAITIGDINGIGPEVILKCLSDRRILKYFTPLVIGPASVLGAYAKSLKVDVARIPIEATEVSGLEGGEEGAVFVVDPMPDQDPPIRPGQTTETAGRIAMASVTQATDLCLERKVDAMVTAPISKEAIARAGFNVPGHTEFIASRSNSARFTMLMVAEKTRVGLVTTHVPLAQVPAAISTASILEKIRIICESLTGDFGIARPRLAVLGLNPHAGDGGVIGTEEQDVILPAINQARNEGRLAYGPFPADGFFASLKHRSYDAVLAMYHDQGLVPFKVLSFNSGINFTAGLPIVRTSPDHGTAFDIAGSNQASPESMRNAIYAAIDIARRRADRPTDREAGEPDQDSSREQAA